MQYKLAIKREHKDINEYFFYEGQEEKDFPKWFDSSMVDEKTGDIEFTIKDLESNGNSHVMILRLADVAVYNPSRNKVEIMPYYEFANTYNRVED